MMGDHASRHGYLYLANLLAGVSNFKTSGCFFCRIPTQEEELHSENFRKPHIRFESIGT
jgi:hypothetical protein